MQQVSFDSPSTPFFATLKKRVNQYFKENEISKSGNLHLHLKSTFQACTAILLFVVLVFFTPSPPIAVALCVLMGVNMAILGFNVMHEGGHQTFSKHKWLNNTSAFTLNLLGGTIWFWKIKHNINHHTFTNIEGKDDDIDVKPFMRLHEEQAYHKAHRFQHWYCFILYGISHFVWLFWDDFEKYFTGRLLENGNTMPLSQHVVFWSTKLIYIGVYMVLPIIMVGLVPAIIGFSIASFVCGLTLAIVFQLAHVVGDTQFPAPNDQTGKVGSEWAVHQMNTTANFATKNKFVSWMLGGLNFQVEHHLFPQISHVHYPKVNEIIKETCKEYNVTYIEYESMIKAIGAHLSHLKELGKSPEIA